jgi:hypothetical protein
LGVADFNLNDDDEAASEIDNEAIGLSPSSFVLIARIEGAVGNPPGSDVDRAAMLGRVAGKEVGMDLALVGEALTGCSLKAKIWIVEGRRGRELSPLNSLGGSKVLRGYEAGCAHL